MTFAKSESQQSASTVSAAATYKCCLSSTQPKFPIATTFPFYKSFPKDYRHDVEK